MITELILNPISTAEWIAECEDQATVEALLMALSHEHFTDIKIKVEDIINVNWAARYYKTSYISSERFMYIFNNKLFK